MKRSASILISFLLHLSVSAQVPDSLKHETKSPAADSVKVLVKAPIAESFLEKDFFPNHTNYSAFDTSLNGVQKYFPNNYPFGLGSSNRKLVFEPSMQIGFRSGLESLDMFGYNKEEIKYYRTRTPYTEIFVLFGQKKEQFARVLHTQNVTKQWNIAVNLLRIRSEGFYQRQNGTDNNVSLSSNYTSRNNRYSFLLNGIVTSIKTDENGGVKSDTLFEENLFVNKKLFNVNLLDARTQRGSGGVYMAHFINFGKRDTAKTDSTHRKRILPTTSLSYSFGIRGNWYKYTDGDPASGYYDQVFFDSVLTKDSTHYKELEHGLSLQSILLKRIKVNAGVKQINTQFVQYNADSSLSLDTMISNQIVKFGIGNFETKNKIKGFFWSLGKEYVLAGANEGEDYIFGNIKWVFKKKQYVSLDHQSVFHSAPFIYNYYDSNHFYWRNVFYNTSERVETLAYSDPLHKLTVGVKHIYVAGYVYLDSNCTPFRHNGQDALTINTFFLKKHLQTKHFGFYTNTSWQMINSIMRGMDDQAIHLPALITNNSIYYQGKWFKKAVDVQLGFDVTYFTAYYADAYTPALGLYHWQNRKEIGNYPFVDLFFNMKVKHAKVFFKTEHLNSGWMGPYYLAPNMPAPDRSIKVGISWAFYD